MDHLIPPTADYWGEETAGTEESRAVEKASTAVPPREHEAHGTGEIMGPEGVLGEDGERVQRQVQPIP